MWWPLACSSVRSSVIMPTWPFQNTRSPRLRLSRSLTGSGRAERRRLHVAVAQSWRPQASQRQLHEARAIDARRRLAAPQIGTRRNSLAPPRRNRFDVLAIGMQMRGEHKAPPDSCEIARAALRLDRDLRIPASERAAPAALQVRLRIDEGARHGHRWVGATAAAQQRVAGRSRHSRRVTSCTQAQPSSSSKTLHRLAAQRLRSMLHRRRSAAPCGSRHGRHHHAPAAARRSAGPRPCRRAPRRRDRAIGVKARIEMSLQCPLEALRAIANRVGELLEEQRALRRCAGSSTLRRSFSSRRGSPVRAGPWCRARG